MFQTNKNIALEALRGIAALSVVAWHCLLAFWPAQGGIFNGYDPSLSLWHSPFFAFLNGTFAVVIFFVLSGYVLTIKHFENPNDKMLVVGAIKRWPRLVPLVLFSTLFAFITYKFGLHFYFEAAQTEKSPWLTLMGYGFKNLSNTELYFSTALYQGLVSAFFYMPAGYNSSLWTMSHEFFGSIISLLIAFILTFKFKKYGLFFKTLLIAVIYILATGKSLYLASFIIGTFIAYTRSKYIFNINIFYSFILFIFALLLGGMDGKSGFLDKYLTIQVTYSYILGAVILIAIILNNTQISNFLNRPWGAFLGKISFPVYLMHVPLLCSLGSYVFIKSQSGFLATGATFLLTFIIALPMAKFDIFWVKFVSHHTKRIVTRFFP